MISIRNASLALLANIKRATNAVRTEAINAANTIEFTAVLDAKAAETVESGNIADCAGDYFDIVYYDKAINEDGTKTVKCEAEHVSYRLNNPAYDLDLFGMSGTPTAILAAILAGTGFTVGTVEPTTAGAYTINEKTSRRALLIGYTNAIGAELSFDKFSVSMLNHRGSEDQVLYTAGKNLRIINKIFNGRKTPAEISYTAEPIVLPNKALSLGDEVLLVQTEFGVSESLRIVSLSYDPMDKQTLEIEISNYVQTLESQFYQMAQASVAKDKVYHGVRIGPEFGFESIRSNKKARSIVNSDTLAWQIGDGSGDNWVDTLYYDSTTNKIKFSGDIEMLGGSIAWGDDGVAHDPAIGDTALAAWADSDYATYIDANGVYSGSFNGGMFNVNPTGSSTLPSGITIGGWNTSAWTGEAFRMAFSPTGNNGYPAIISSGATTGGGILPLIFTLPVGFQANATFSSGKEATFFGNVHFSYNDVYFPESTVDFSGAASVIGLVKTSQDLYIQYFSDHMEIKSTAGGTYKRITYDP